MRLVLMVEKPDGLWEFFFFSGSPCLDAPVMSTRWQQREQSMAWVAVVLNDFRCFPKALCVVDALHSWEMAADDVAAAKPGSNAAREDALDGAPVKVSEGFCTCQTSWVSSESKSAFGQFLQPNPLEMSRLHHKNVSLLKGD